ncbi:hypothetical protein ACFE04_024674 [Oxalis oulophora]
MSLSLQASYFGLLCIALVVPILQGGCFVRRVAMQMATPRKNDKKGKNLVIRSNKRTFYKAFHLHIEDPVLKGHQWSAYIDRSPGAAVYSEVEKNVFVVFFSGEQDYIGT